MALLIEPGFKGLKQLGGMCDLRLFRKHIKQKLFYSISVKCYLFLWIVVSAWVAVSRVAFGS